MVITMPMESSVLSKRVNIILVKQFPIYLYQKLLY